MSIKLEEMFNEFRYPSSITTDKDITTSGTLTAGNLTTTTTQVAGAFDVQGAFTVSGAATVTGAATLNGGVTVIGTTVLPARVSIGTGAIIFGSNPNGATGPTGVTAPTGSLYLSYTGTATNNRAFINTDGATAWTSITTAA